MKKTNLIIIALSSLLLFGCGSTNDYRDLDTVSDTQTETAEDTQPEDGKDENNTDSTGSDVATDEGIVNDDNQDGDTDTVDGETEEFAPAGSNLADATVITESEVNDFLHSPGVNGLLWEEFADVYSDEIGIYNIVYQLGDDTVDWNVLFDYVEAEYGEVYTDVSYISSSGLDEFLKKVLGVGINNGNISKNADYCSPLDTYFIMHGDTNYTTFTLSDMYVSDNKIYATLTDIDQFDNRDICVTMEVDAPRNLRICSIEKIGPQPHGLGYGSEFVFENSQYELIDESDLYGLTEWELKVARNEIFARHGRKFNNENLQFYFDNCSWYVGIYSPDEFDPSCLNRIELDNLDIIDKFTQ